MSCLGSVYKTTNRVCICLSTHVFKIKLSVLCTKLCKNDYNMWITKQMICYIFLFNNLFFLLIFDFLSATKLEKCDLKGYYSM